LNSIEGLHPNHKRITIQVIGETWLVFILLAVLATDLGPPAMRTPLNTILYLLVLLSQGLILQRLYYLAHEAVHHKLWPFSARVNDGLAQALLLPHLLPLQIYRQLHLFHHEFNRRDARTNALDVIILPQPVTRLRRVGAYMLWFWKVFLGGFFLSELIVVIAFLFAPAGREQEGSSIFTGWTGGNRQVAWGELLAGLALHAVVALIFGWRVWLFTLGLPFLVFAWVWSLLVMVYHYRTGLGDQVAYNGRSILCGRLAGWLFVNYHEHIPHHVTPATPWYYLPDEFVERNQDIHGYPRAILQQLAGPTVIPPTQAEQNKD
jgi:fatty acid desaturase